VDTHLVLLQHHKIKMLDSLLRILPHPLDERRIRNDVTDVFIDERIPASKKSASHPPNINFEKKKKNPHLGMSSTARSP